MLAGLVFNKVRPLDLVRERNSGTEMMGHVKLLDNIPYNCRTDNMELFERMQQTQTSNSPGLQDDIIVRVGPKCGSSQGRYVSAECFRYSGDGDELITPVYNAPTLPPFRVSQEQIFSSIIFDVGMFLTIGKFYNSEFQLESSKVGMWR